MQEQKKPKYTGLLPAPEVFSTLSGGMVPTGRDLHQCPDCGFWMSDKPSPSEEQEHDRQCRPRFAPNYVRRLAKLKKIRTKKVDDRTKLYNREDCESYNVAPHQGQRVREGRGSMTMETTETIIIKIKEGLTRLTDEQGNILLTIGLQENHVFVWAADGTVLQRSYRDILKMLASEESQGEDQ